jgi:hypothetical protein
LTTVCTSNIFSAMTTPTIYRGRELQAIRTARRPRVTVTALARAMGYSSHANVSHLERQDVVSPDMAARYLAALSTFPNVETSPEAA